MLTAWSAGPVVDRDPATVVELFVTQAAKTPDAVAVRTHGAQLTFRELDERSNQLAGLLLERGAGSDRPVGVCLRRSPELLPTLLGVWKAGAPYLPLDADLPALRVGRMLDAADCALVITATGHLPLFEGFDSEALILLDAQHEAIAARPVTPVAVPTGPAHPAYIMFTSGSTGTPKGVLVHHGGLANYLLWAVDTYIADGTGGSPFLSSIAFDLGVPSLFAPLLAGQPVHLLPDPLDPADLGALLAAEAPYSFVKLTPGHLDLLSPRPAARRCPPPRGRGDPPWTRSPGTLALALDRARRAGDAGGHEYWGRPRSPWAIGAANRRPDAAQLIPLAPRCRT